MWALASTSPIKAHAAHEVCGMFTGMRNCKSSLPCWCDTPKCHLMPDISLVFAFLLPAPPEAVACTYQQVSDGHVKLWPKVDLTHQHINMISLAAQQCNRRRIRGFRGLSWHICVTSIHADTCAWTKLTMGCCSSCGSWSLIASSYAASAAADGLNEELSFSNFTAVVHKSSLCCICC